MPLYQRDNIPLEKFIQLIPDLVYIQEFPSKKITFMNRKFTDILGYQKEDLIQNDFSLDFALSESELMKWELRLEEYNKIINTGERIEYNIEVKHKNGSKVILRHRSMVLRSQSPEAQFEILHIAEDITQLQKHNELILQQRNQLNEAEKIFKYGSWEWYVGADTVRWSDGLYDVFGYDAKDFEVKEMTYGFYQKHIPVHEHEYTRSISEQSVQDKKNYYELEHSIIDAKGVFKYLAVKGKCYLDTQGNVTKVLGTSADITQIKNYELALEKKIEELFRSNQDLEQFAYIASHDLQEPLRKITAFANKLIERCADGLNEDGRFFVDRILYSSDRMKSLIDNLLAYSRISRNNIPLPFSEVNLNQIVQNAIGDLEIAVAKKNAQITVDDLPTIQAFPSQMHQLFLNLISNAIKFVDESTQPLVNIKVEEASLEEILRLKLTETQYWKISISDNGIGFEDEYKEKIFTMFHRVHGNAEFEGTGLGLAICAKIVENHQGHLSAQSTLQQGSVFTLYLPFKP
ncbi:sensor histidine kinase [Flectobacillus rivi]|uniref:histidine kinase n=1 Tax=Flectobacillus rivi TaxID=2984209 RepID=A0ABT6YWN9_9BACT|nr:ATP-binding protein [Flectobacillus rivi]MDI9873300.1 ATP-binding protein [Flectobacillus rivi]